MTTRARCYAFECKRGGGVYRFQHHAQMAGEPAVSDRSRLDRVSETTASPPMADAPQPGGRWPNASVLVVDDEPGMRNFLVKTLAPSVGLVMDAGSAEDAELLLAHRRFDLAIVDITLPGKSGIELLKQLRADGHSAEVILITAVADLEMAIEALRAGAGDFLLTPMRVTQVQSAVRVSALYHDLAHDPDAGHGAEPVDLATLEKRHIRAVLESVGGDKRRAARLLGISRRTLERRLADWAVNDPPP